MCIIQDQVDCQVSEMSRGCPSWIYESESHAIFVCLQVCLKLQKGRGLAVTTNEKNVGKIQILTPRALLISIPKIMMKNEKCRQDKC